MKTRRRLLRPFTFTRVLVARRRTQGNDLVLATVLAALAGAANAGGFFVLGQYTSHMTGYLSQLADNLALVQVKAVGVSLLALSSFVVGAGFSAILINGARLVGGRKQYAWPLVIQGAFLVCFSFGGVLSGEIGRLFALSCLCFMMGMQNATITKISGARIRTTHATGMITDIGIELGRAVFARIRPGSGVRTDRQKLRILVQLVGAFLMGGLIGALGYGRVGFFFALPSALILMGLGLPGILQRSRPRT